MPRFWDFACFAILNLSLIFSAPTQQQQPAARPQTPRQALLEIVTKGGEGISRHLTVEVQEFIANPSNKDALGLLAGLSSMKPEKGLQTFDSGPVLFVYNDSAQRTKYEVRVDSDDMASDQDDLQLSLHVFRNGQEQEQEFGFLSPRFTVSLKLQQSIWRINNVSIGVDLPLGSPEYFKKNLFRGEAKEATGTGLVAGTTGGAAPREEKPVVISLPPQQVVMLLAYAENAFAHQHPENGFTCSIAPLVEVAQVIGLDPQVATGVYNGYRFSLTGCEGKPAGSFQITAEPVGDAIGTRAFCTDATQNLRISEDGRGPSCLSFGKAFKELSNDEGEMRGVPIPMVSAPKK